jgi:DNA sulfur modification protein DndD
MIIDRIVLNNFGVFVGRHEIVLTPPSPEKPVILIGGQNGGGKTTLLDSLQLAFYGPSARCAGRGKLAYKDYLSEMIHTGVSPAEGASVQVQFRRVTEGKTRTLVVTRTWSDLGKGIEEFVEVVKDKVRDPVLSEHWAEYIENYLPNRLASLFFFDGEQIATMAEDEHAAGMLETALQSLLGLDLVEQLRTDLTVLQRRKQEADAPADVRKELLRLDAEVKKAEQEVAEAVQEQARLQALLDHLQGRELADLKKKFSKDGGDLFLKRKELEESKTKTCAEVTALEHDLREIAAGPGPLLLVDELLHAVEEQATAELDVQRTQLLADAEVERDRKVIESLRRKDLEAGVLETVKKALAANRHSRVQTEVVPYLDPPPDLPQELRRLREATLPMLRTRVAALLHRLHETRERLTQLETQLAGVPAADAIGKVQQQIQALETQIHDTEVQVRMAAELVRQRQNTLVQIQRTWQTLFDENAENREHDEDNERILVRIPRLQTTLDELRRRVIARHITTFERLILESFQCLLHKTRLVTALQIDPQDFRITLTGGKGQTLPFQRLSAGERQLLAASILWGLAKASGRPVPTFIDTPLGRLDSSHRKHVVERYFPAASHQVVLLSTDEEVVGKYRDILNNHVGHYYLLVPDTTSHGTEVQEGYFQHETTH